MYNPKCPITPLILFVPKLTTTCYFKMTILHFLNDYTLLDLGGRQLFLLVLVI